MGVGGQGGEEGPVHDVVISRPFAIGVYEVTAGEWDACVGAGVCQKGTGASSDKRLPVANVSWDDAQAYLKWLSGHTKQVYRLPTEAEWEYAARAGSVTRYWWGDDKGVGRANCADCGSPWGGQGAAPVGSFKANPFGLHDVHGNVWEWTQDCWNRSYQGAPSDGGPWLQGDCLARVLRGGSWALDREYMRSARRHHYDRDVRYQLNGLRVVRELPVPAQLGKPDEDVSFDEGIVTAVEGILATLPTPLTGAPVKALVMDPVVDGLTGAETFATRAMGSRVKDVVQSSSPGLRLEDFSAPGSPYTYVVIGTFTGVNKERKPIGEPVAFRICLALLDRESRKIVAKAKVFARPDRIDNTLTSFFQDSPAWAGDPSTQAYIASCQATQPGDPIDPRYLDTIEAAGLVHGAIIAYEGGQLDEAGRRFKTALRTRGGDQLRAYNGLYLTSWRQGDWREAADAFAKLVAHAIDGPSLWLKFPFEPGSTGFEIDKDGAAQAEIWLGGIAREMLRRKECFQIQGHGGQDDGASPAEGLDLGRAEYIKRRLEAEAPELIGRVTATGQSEKDHGAGGAGGYSRDGLQQGIEIRSVACPPSR
jgi:hypothetical protein